MTAIDFSRRSMRQELMDTEPVGFAEFHQCLQQLEVVNVLALANRPTLRWLRRELKGARPGDAVSIIDVGSGGGGMLRLIWKMLHRRGLKAGLTGVDINPWSKQSAEQITPKELGIHFETADIFSFDPARRADYVISASFTHHLTDADLVRFIRWMDAHATRGWFVNDLHRHPFPYYFIKIMFRLLRFSRMMQSDGPISISRAFTSAEWHRLLAEAGIADGRARIRWLFPFRYVVECSKT